MPFSATEAALVGREAETAELLAALDSPGPSVAWLVAAGGMGKSRLLKELAERGAEVQSATTRGPDLCQSEARGLGHGLAAYRPA